MAYFRASIGGGGTSGVMDMVACDAGTGAKEIIYSGNTSSTLYLLISVTGSSNQTYRERSADLSAFSGCIPIGAKMVSVNNQTFKLYKLTECGSTVSAAATSYGSSAIVKMLSIHKIT